MDEKDKKQHESKPDLSFFLRLRNYFMTGLFLVAPTALSIGILIYVFQIFDGILGQLYERFLFEPFNLPLIPGLGALTLAVTITLIGMTARLYVGRKMFGWWENAIKHVPLLNRIYIAIKQLAEALEKGGGFIFQGVVVVQYPRERIYSIGFLTNTNPDVLLNHIDVPVSSVFMPTTPNPTSGVLIFVPDEDLIHLRMSVEDAMKLVISAGSVTPVEIDKFLDKLQS